MIYLPPSEVIGAEYGPGFSADLTHWRVFIDRRRWLRQEVVVVDFDREDKGEILRYYKRLSRAEFAELWAIIGRIGFREFERRYKHQTCCVTDRETYWITVRFPDRKKEVEVYDPRWLAEFENNAAAIGFLELWDAIHRHAPHGKVPIQQGRRKRWWFW